jgi:hypothetical protein
VRFLLSHPLPKRTFSKGPQVRQKKQESGKILRTLAGSTQCASHQARGGSAKSAKSAKKAVKLNGRVSGCDIYFERAQRSRAAAEKAQKKLF